MTYLRRNTITFADGPSIDGFARARFSQAETLFQSKLLYDKGPGDWSEAVIGSATSTHIATSDCVRMAVTGNGDAVVRQTYGRFNYQSGKSLLILATGTLGPQTANVTKRVGFFNSSIVSPFTDSYDGIYFEDTGADYRVCVAHQGAVDAVARADWAEDKLDGTGPSGLIYDFTKSTIWIIDLEWLGVGRVRVGVVVNGIPVYVHYFNHAGVVEEVYMESPNHSIRYEIRSSGGASSFDQICCTVQSESGFSTIGLARSHGTGITGAQSITATSPGTYYALFGIRLQSAKLDASTFLNSLGVIAVGGANFNWQVRLNPTVGGTFTYADKSDSVLQIAPGDPDGTNTVTGGIVVNQGLAAAETSTAAAMAGELQSLGASVTGVANQLVICASAGTNNENFHGSLTWREII